jgi:hypothetical protein
MATSPRPPRCQLPWSPPPSHIETNR